LQQKRKTAEGDFSLILLPFKNLDFLPSVGVGALEDLLPEVEVLADCLFNCSPRE